MNPKLLYLRAMQIIIDNIIEAWRAQSWLELGGVFFGILYLLLATKESLWCWLAGLISVLLYIKICFDAQLYAETGLQFFYLFISFYGWYQWKYGKAKQRLPISKLSLQAHLVIISVGLLFTWGMAYILSVSTQAALPYLDSFTTVFSIITTWMVARKKIENWLYWIVVDGVGVYIYWSRGLYLTSLLFLAYVIIVIFGYFEWKRIIDRSSE